MRDLTALTTEYPDFSSVSEKYKFISSKQFIQDVEAVGFSLTKVAGPKRGKGFGKHLMEFTHANLPSVNGNSVRLLAINAHNGTSSFQFKLGVFRLVCSNGLVVGTSVQSERVIHVGYAATKVAQATQTMLERAQGLATTIAHLQAIVPASSQHLAFVKEAAKLRPNALPANAMDLDAARRSEDRACDAWTIYNRVQESLIRGGYNTAPTFDANLQRYVRGNRARGLTGIQAGLKLNQALWDLAVSTLVGLQ